MKNVSKSISIFLTFNKQETILFYLFCEIKGYNIHKQVNKCTEGQTNVFLYILELIYVNFTVSLFL